MATPTRDAYDAVVIGAGVVGLAAAWRAAQRGLSVLVVERDEPGAGASGVAAGMLAPVTEVDFGEGELIGLNRAGAALWPGFRTELEAASGLTTGYRASGALAVALDRDDREALQRLHRLQLSLGLEAEWLPSRECRRLEPALSPRVTGGVLVPGDHQVDPAAVVRALAVALDREAGELLTRTAVESVAVERGAVAGVTTAAGTIRAPAVVAATGCWAAGLGGIPEADRPPVRPVRGQVLAMCGRADSPLAGRIVRTPRCYVVPRADGRVVIGATTEERGFDARVTGEGVYRLLESAWEVLPGVGELEFTGAQAGLRPGSPDNGPIVGAARTPGLVWATGHHRGGVLLAPITAEAVARRLCGEPASEPMDRFTPARFAGRAIAGAAGRAAAGAVA